jgi:hypothetical protein
MALSIYGTQFRVIPDGETVEFSHAKTLVDMGQPVNVSFVSAIADKGLSTQGVITGVTMTNTSCILTGTISQFYITTYTLSGKYGDDLTTRDVYQVINTNNYDPNASSFYGSEAKPTGDFQVTTYNSYSALVAARATSSTSTTGWNNIVKFYPEDTPEKLVTYTFTAQGEIVEFTQMVHLIPTRHFTRLQSLVQGIAPGRVIQDASGNVITPTYISDPPGWVEPAE